MNESMTRCLRINKLKCKRKKIDVKAIAMKPCV